MKLIIETNRYNEHDAIEAIGAGGLHGLHKYEDWGISLDYVGIEGAFDNYDEYIDCITAVIKALIQNQIPFKVEYPQ